MAHEHDQAGRKGAEQSQATAERGAMEAPIGQHTGQGAAHGQQPGSAWSSYVRQLKAGGEAQRGSGGGGGGAGERLPAAVQAKMSDSLGADFSGVTVHQGEAAASVGAQAFAQTTGQGEELHFAPGKYDPQSSGGQALIGHELAHIVQQRSGRAKGAQNKGGINSDAALESEADRAGEAAARGERFQVQGAGGGIQRKVQPKGPVSPESITIPQGSHYTVTAEDMAQGGGDDTWRHIARSHGMMGETLKVYNVQVVQKTVRRNKRTIKTDVQQVLKLEEGVEVYIPSTDEILFAQIYERHRDYAAAEAEYGELKGSGNLKILDTARDRASGTVGKGYGTMGVDGDYDKIGYFLSPNPTLAGASSRRTEEVNGQTNYKVVWVNDWKCNIFMNDTMYAAGYEPAHRSTGKKNKYYAAGQAHVSGAYDTLGAQEARPGDGFQKFGGSGSNESHNAILSSYVEVSSAGGGYENWKFSIIGAESDRAGEGIREYKVKKGTNETSSGLQIRFLRPKNERTEE